MQKTKGFDDLFMEKITIGKPFNTKFDFRETCFGICEKDGKMLLTQKLQKNEYSLVGGGIENGESHTECLIREFKEESGYSIKNIKELCIVDCYWLAGGKWPMHSLANFYIVEVNDNPTKPLEDGHTPIWVETKRVKEFCPLPYHQTAIEYYETHKATT